MLTVVPGCRDFSVEALMVMTGVPGCCDFRVEAMTILTVVPGCKGLGVVACFVYTGSLAAWASEWWLRVGGVVGG